MSSTPEQQKKLVANLLSAFDDNMEAAIQAVRNARSPQPKPKLKPTDKRTIIRIDALEKTYKIGRQHVTALNNISLEIGEGEFIAITGPSGSGKSTLLQLMGGLDKPTSGQVEVNGQDISKLSDAKLSEFRGQTIGFVFQFFYLQPYLKIKTNLAVPAMFARTSAETSREQVRELAEAVGINDRLEHYPKEISGGQIQRAAIARALLNKPKIILADEPTGNLDSQTSNNIIDLLEKVRADYNSTVIIATHDSSIARRADRIIKIQDGSVA